jgi:hypothetical protein
MACPFVLETRNGRFVFLFEMTGVGELCGRSMSGFRVGATCSATERDPVSGRTKEIEGSTGGTGDSTASETRIPNLGVAGMDEVTSANVTG